MSILNNNEEYQEAVKDKHLIIVYDNFCSLSDHFIKKIKEINFEKIFLVTKNSKDLFNKLLIFTTPTIILNSQIIYPADIKSLNNIIKHSQ